MRLPRMTVRRWILVVAATAATLGGGLDIHARRAEYHRKSKDY